MSRTCRILAWNSAGATVLRNRQKRLLQGRVSLDPDVLERVRERGDMLEGNVTGLGRLTDGGQVTERGFAARTI